MLFVKVLSLLTGARKTALMYITIMCLHAIEIYLKQSQKREMLFIKVLSLLTGARKTALN